MHLKEHQLFKSAVKLIWESEYQCFSTTQSFAGNCVQSLQGGTMKVLIWSLLLPPLKPLKLWAWVQSIFPSVRQPNLMAASYSLGLNFLSAFLWNQNVLYCCSAFSTWPLRLKNAGWFRFIPNLLLCQRRTRMCTSLSFIGSLPG